MGFFSRNKKTEAASCCCGGSCTPEAMAQAEAGKALGEVKVLGSGCANAMLWSRQSMRPWLSWVWRLPLTT